MDIVFFVALAIASGGLVSLALHFGEKKRPQHAGKVTIDVECDAASAVAAMQEVRDAAEEVERTFGRIEQRQERVLAAVREAQQRRKPKATRRKS